MANSMTWYKENNDFLGALERFNATSARWVKEWYNVCLEIYERTKAEVGEYIFNGINYTIKKTKAVLSKKTKNQERIVIAEGVDTLDNVKNKCYLFAFFDKNNSLVCSKIGTTTRKVITRLAEELKSKTYTAMGCVKAVILKVYDCGMLAPEGLESYFRAKYIKKYPDSFCKNDRFIKTAFDLKEADKIATKYLSKGVLKND